LRFLVTEWRQVPQIRGLYQAFVLIRQKFCADYRAISLFLWCCFSNETALSHMRNFLLGLLGAIALFGAGCQTNTTEQNNTASGVTAPIGASEEGTISTSNNGLTLHIDATDAWTYENLRLYPIVADEATVAAQASVGNLRTLAEGMQTPGFRITERKNFGREQGNWYNGLTVVNKTDQPVFLMSGDVVKGGNQDRVNEEDFIAMSGSVRNFPVFCVERGRSHYYNESAPAAEKKLAAFYGFYSIASPSVRKAVYAGNQQEVWNNVAKVTTEHNATSSTGTYAQIEAAQGDAANRRTACIQHFNEQLKGHKNTVGLVAVCNGKVIGVEIFGHPDLFSRRQQALLHSFAVEALAQPTDKEATYNQADTEAAFKSVAALANTSRKPSESAGRFSMGEQWVHLYKK
jgi:hypothetical protein